MSCCDLIDLACSSILEKDVGKFECFVNFCFTNFVIAVNFSYFKHFCKL